jgi:hypothetical protein
MPRIARAGVREVPAEQTRDHAARREILISIHISINRDDLTDQIAGAVPIRRAGC